jgi:protein tyrosine phosphatase (PTP) superfamily phosphohydrolase (DUF442 family)
MLTMKQKSFLNVLGILVAILAMSVVSAAQTADQKTAEQTTETNVTFVRIKNFGQMDGRFYRGAQPAEKDYKDLVTLGIKTVIDLREDSVPSERSFVESLGMRYINIPMAGKKYPTPEVTEMFLKTVNDPATGKFFVHCAGGRHRTGAMGAVYRYEFYHWTFDQAYKEMKQYDFYTTWGHQSFKDFVRDYYARQPGTPKLSAPDAALIKEKQ